MSFKNIERGPMAVNYYNLTSRTPDANMNGPRRVILFCFLIVVLPTILIFIALYLRRNKFSDVNYAVSESDVVEIRSGQSSIFCQEHSLKMNSSFNAFQMIGAPELSNSRKHIRLKKSMILPDDTLEYWGFYLLKGATMHLKMCSRHRGSRVLVVKGERFLETCDLLEHNEKKFGPSLAEGHGKVAVTFDAPAELVDTVNHPKTDFNTASERFSKETIDETDDKQTFRNVVRKKRTSSRGPQAYDYISERTKSRRDLSHIPNHVLDGGVNHGGNAMNYTDDEQESSVSSFENDLLQCFDGKILFSDGFKPSTLCENVQYLENSHEGRMMVTYDVLSNGYYYYIFYSDNDNVKNDIHTIFDIYKPTLQYTSLPKSKQCINQTSCNFPVTFMSDEVVVVEVPTRDGIEQEEDDITLLVSTCHPRMVVYAIFPISVILIVLICAFL